MAIIKALWTVFRLLINSCLFISIAALTCALQTYLLFDKPLKLNPLVILVFFATLFTYTWHRMLSNKVRLPYAAEGMHQWIRSHDWWPKLAIALSIIAMAICVCYLSKPVQIALVILGAISVFYALPIPLGKDFKIRLRDLGLLKPFVLGTVWGIATALLPLLDMGVPVFSREALLIIAKRILFISAICIPFDIKDMEFDRHTMRFPTIPLMFGEKAARYIGFAVLTLFEILVCIHNGFSPVGIALTGSYLLTGAVILFPNPQHNEYHYTFSIDATILVQFLFVWAAVTFFGG